MTSMHCYGQEYTYEEKTIAGIFTAEGKTKDEIFSSINKWISLNYNSAQDAVQFNDKESGNIIVKGINKAIYKNVTEEYITVKINHTLEINVKNNRYRLIYTSTDVMDLKPVAGDNLEQQYDLIFNMIDFTGLKQDKVDNYDNYVEELWKNELVGKRKRAKLKEQTRPAFEKMNEELIQSIKLTMLSAQKTVKSIKKDDW